MTTSVLHRISFYSVVNGYYQHLELKQLCNRNIDHKHSSQTWLWRLWWSAFLVMSWCLSGEMQLWNSLLLLFSCDLTNMIIITSSSYYNDHDQIPSSRPPSYWNHDDACDKDIGKLFFPTAVCLLPVLRFTLIWVETDHMSWCYWLQMAFVIAMDAMNASPSSQRRSRLLFGRDFLPLCFVDFFTLWLRDFCFHFVSRFRRRWRLAGGTGEIWFGRDTFSSLCWPLSSLWPAWWSSSWSRRWPWWSSDIGGTRWKSRLSRDPLLLFPS